MESKIKRLARLHGKYRHPKHEWGNSYNRGKYVPWLNVNGVWLERAGFKIGDQIEIDVTTNQLVIKKCSDGDHGN